MSAFTFCLGSLTVVADTVGLVAFSHEVVDPQGHVMPILVGVEDNPDMALEIGLQLKALTEVWWRILMPQVRDARFSAPLHHGDAVTRGTAGQETNNIAYNLKENV